MLKYAFIDWDYTLYDTKALEEGIFAVYEKYGVSKIDCAAAFQRSLCTVSPLQYDYTFEEHTAFLRELGYELPEGVVDELNQLVENNYLYTGAQDFVQYAKTIADKVVLLSAGDKQFQMRKFHGCGADQWFDDIIIIPGGKDKYICDNYGIENFIFVNDNLRECLAVKKCAPEALVVIRYESKRYTQPEVEATNLPYFKTLTEIKKYVSGLI